MAIRLFLDINVILDIIDDARPSHQSSVKLWIKAVDESAEIFISEDMLSTIFYISRDKKHTLEFLQAIQSRWQIVSFGKKVILDAISYSIEKDIDLEDMLQCLCAKEHGCVFITNDKKFYDCGVEICSVDDFLER